MSPLEIPSRIPPHNLDTERAVLGAVLLEGREALPRVIEVLRPTDFYTESHRAIFTTMQTLFGDGRVYSISGSIAYNTWSWMTTPDDGNALPNF